MQHPRQRPQQGSFPESGYAFKKDVPPREQADEDPIHHFLLADNHFPNLLAHPIQLLGGELKSRVRFHA